MNTTALLLEGTDLIWNRTQKTPVLSSRWKPVAESQVNGETKVTGGLSL